MSLLFGRRHRLLKYRMQLFLSTSWNCFILTKTFFSKHKREHFLSLWIESMTWRCCVTCLDLEIDLEMDDFRNTSSETYKGHTEICTVMCFEFIKDWGSESDHIILFQIGTSNENFEQASTSLKDICDRICVFSRCWYFNQQILIGKLSSLVRFSIW